MTSPELPFVTGRDDLGRSDGVPERAALRKRARLLASPDVWGRHSPVQREAGLGAANESPSQPPSGRVGDHRGLLREPRHRPSYHNRGLPRLRRLAWTWSPSTSASYLNPYKAHAARAAHQLNIAMGSHTFLSADERDRLIVHQTLSAFIGSAARRSYLEWGAIDPEQLIVGGNLRRDAALEAPRAHRSGLHRHRRGALRPVRPRGIRPGVLLRGGPTGVPARLAAGAHLRSRPLDHAKWSPVLFDAAPAGRGRLPRCA